MNGQLHARQEATADHGPSDRRRFRRPIQPWCPAAPADSVAGHPPAGGAAAHRRAAHAAAPRCIPGPARPRITVVQIPQRRRLAQPIVVHTRPLPNVVPPTNQWLPRPQIVRDPLRAVRFRPTIVKTNPGRLPSPAMPAPRRSSAARPQFDRSRRWYCGPESSAVRDRRYPSQPLRGCRLFCAGRQSSRRPGLTRSHQLGHSRGQLRFKPRSSAGRSRCPGRNTSSRSGPVLLVRESRTARQLYEFRRNPEGFGRQFCTKPRPRWRCCSGPSFLVR